MAIADPLNSRQHFAYVGRLVIRRAERVLSKKAEVVILKKTAALRTPIVTRP
jgi:hypothetical protein